MQNLLTIITMSEKIIEKDAEEIIQQEKYKVDNEFLEQDENAKNIFSKNSQHGIFTNFVFF